jgi:hypothetical protein
LTALRYLLDEHVKSVLFRGLKRWARDLIVWRISDPGAPGPNTPDPELLAWYDSHGFILVTNNRSTVPVHLAEHLAAVGHVPGIFMLNPELSIGDTIQEPIDAAYASLEDEYRDQIRYLPLL